MLKQEFVDNHDIIVVAHNDPKIIPIIGSYEFVRDTRLKRNIHIFYGLSNTSLTIYTKRILAQTIIQ